MPGPDAGRRPHLLQDAHAGGRADPAVTFPAPSPLSDGFSVFGSQRQMARPSLQYADMSVPLSPSEQVTPIFDDMHSYGNMMHMRTTLILDDTLIAEARRLTGLTEKTAIVHAGLQALISRESARRLANLGGSDTHAAAPPRRRTAMRRAR